MSDLIEIENVERTFGNRLTIFRIKNIGHINMLNFFQDAYIYFEPMIESLLDIHYLAKISVCLHAIFEKKVFSIDGGESIVTQPRYIHLPQSEIIDFETNLKDFYDEYVIKFFTDKVGEIELAGSGFTLQKIVDFEVQVSSYDPYNGASYIALPKKLDDKGACINVRNEDNMCFKYAILSAMYPGKNSHRVSRYTNLRHDVNFDNISFPVGLKELKKFEEQNTISVNVYMWDDENGTVRPLRLTKKVKSTHVHLLLLTEENTDSDTPKTHYVWIKNLSALIGRQVSKNCRKKLFCDRCLNHFTNFSKLESHKSACWNQNEYQIIMPPRGSCVKFENFYKQIPLSFVVYADIESILRKPNDDEMFETEKTHATQKHEVVSIGYYSVGAYATSEYRFKTGSNCVNWFVNEMEDLAHIAGTVLSHREPMNLSAEDEVLFIWAEECHICEKPFTDADDKVRDHCHSTGNNNNNNLYLDLSI